MQELPDVTGHSGDGGGSAPAQQQPAFPVGGAGGDGGFTDDGDRNSGGNRWLRQETLALIKIRSDMDATFRDSNLKSPLWDEVSRKLSELGFHRNPMKCKEKFENVYKYNKRTKEGRTSKSEGKTYRFFDQLQALEANAGDTHPSPPLATMKPQSVFVAMSNNNATTTITTTTHSVVPSVISDFNVTGSHQNPSPISVAAPAVVVMPPLPVMNHKRTFPFLQPNGSGLTNSASSSYISSDDQEPPKKKRKWKDFFGKMMKEVIEKQEKLQMKFLDTLERRDRDRVAREEAWRMQEIARVNREHELLARERSIAAAKDTAVITFLQKITGENPNLALHISKQQQQQQQQQEQEQEQQQQQQQQIQLPLAVAPKPPPSPHQPVAVPLVPPPAVAEKSGDNMLSPSPSRWPKAEINALISLRTSLDMNYQENGPKGPLWEEISTAMKKHGYNRSAKRCKEKWENINKYYKKVKDGSKKRSENSKTCPYFDQLDDIYRQKANNNRETQLTSIEARPEQQWHPPTVIKPSTDSIFMENEGNDNLGFSIKHETQIAPIIARPEQQWPPHTAVVQEKQQQLSMADMEENGDDYEDDDEEDDDGDGDGYEIVPNKVSSMAAV